jgi:hypothetical protein
LHRTQREGIEALDFYVAFNMFRFDVLNEPPFGGILKPR